MDQPISVELQAVAQFLTGSQAAAASLPWRRLESEDLRVVRRWAGEALPEASERRLLRELRRALRRHASQDEEAFAGVPSPGVLASRRRREGPAPLGTRPARLLLQVCRDATDPAAARDCALISLMLLAGLRRREVVSLQRGDYDEADGRLVVASRQSGRRGVLLEGECRAGLECWLERRGVESGPLFFASGASSKHLPRGIAASTVNAVVRRRAAEAGLRDVTPRLLRRRFLRQLQARAGDGTGGPACRYHVGEDGQPGWALRSLAAV